MLMHFVMQFFWLFGEDFSLAHSRQVFGLNSSYFSVAASIFFYYPLVLIKEIGEKMTMKNSNCYFR